MLVVAALGRSSPFCSRGLRRDRNPYTGSLPPAQIRLPEFSLPDQFGQPVASSDLAGQVVLVTFLDTQCKEACPIVASVIGEGLRRLDPGERERVTAIAIASIHPRTRPRLSRPSSTGMTLPACSAILSRRSTRSVRCGMTSRLRPHSTAGTTISIPSRSASSNRTGSGHRRSTLGLT